MENLSSDEKFRIKAEKKFSELTIDYQIFEFGINTKAHLFLVSAKPGKKIIDLWEAVRNFIAIEVQSNIEDDFSKWNFYLFFQADDIDNDLKYKIENDTFSSRKIVVNHNSKIEDIIKDHITNSDISIGKIESNAKEPNQFIKNQLISEAIEGKRIKGKQNRTPEIWEALRLIESKLMENEN